LLVSNLLFVIDLSENRARSSTTALNKSSLNAPTGKTEASSSIFKPFPLKHFLSFLSRLLGGLAFGSVRLHLQQRDGPAVFIRLNCSRETI
jgi:hypothetical protein